VYRLVSIVLVSAYLGCVFIYLLARGRIPRAGVRKLAHAWFRPKYRSALVPSSFRLESGHCYVASLPRHLPCDEYSASTLRLREDGHPLGPGHCSHDEVRRLGGGRYSHWGSLLYFSSSDNSDPSSNGRSYDVVEE
jgi:hypothetical protein